MLEQLRAAGRTDALRQNHVFDRDGYACKQSGLLASRKLLVHRPGCRFRALGREVEIRVRLRVLGFCEPERFGGQLHCAETPGSKTLADLTDIESCDVHL